MTATDIFMLVVRWLHVVSAAAWVGGSIFYLLVLRPAMRRSPDAAGIMGRAAATEFRALVDTCIIVLVVTGVVLAFDRLASASVGERYVVVLAVKVVLSLCMFAIAWHRRRRAVSREAEPDSGRMGRVFRALSGYNLLVVLGLVIFLLSDLLRALYELAIAG